MKTKIVGIVASLLVVMLALGVSYALWSTNLYVSGTINTGTVSAEIIAGASYDGDDNVPGKDVSEISALVDGNTLMVTITNAYPSIDYFQEFKVKNTGTIPVKVQSIVISGNASVWVTVSGIAVGDQIEPGQEVNCLLTVHLTNDALQGATYTFTIDIMLVQWNEFQAP